MEAYKTTITNPENPISRYVTEPIRLNQFHTKVLIDLGNAIKNTFESFRKEAATRGNCSDMKRRLEFQLACLDLLEVTGEDAAAKAELEEQVKATIETLKTGVERERTEKEYWDSKPVIDGDKARTHYDTSTPTGFLLEHRDVFENMSLIEFSHSGYCKIM